VGGDIVGRGQPGSPGSDGASTLPELRPTCAEGSRVNPANLPYKLALIGSKPGLSPVALHGINPARRMETNYSEEQAKELRRKYGNRTESRFCPGCQRCGSW
jgi:hypothetical protein